MKSILPVALGPNSILLRVLHLGTVEQQSIKSLYQTLVIKNIKGIECK